MNAVIGKAGKKLFAKHMEQYAPADPLYETYMSEKGQEKRRQRAMPPGLSKRDARILKSVRKRAHYLDKGFNLCGFRFGWTFWIGLVPVVGDVTNFSLNHYLIIRKSKQADIPEWLFHRMELHNIISTGVGFVPMVGDVAMAVYKPNSRNAALLEEFLRIRGEEYLKQNPQEGGRLVGNHGSGWRGMGWLKGQGLSRKDAEQIKPGAGMTADEDAITSGNVANSSSAPGTGRITPSSGVNHAVSTSRK
ncbi:hypothetical protein NP233_g9806 [Leucocoprinus birnbaumii]|uniref:Uncharacterized protein n=1 Tax=Leucocoprinus birnbaumii TaxID=56174 RepID=A0AAD5YQH9_9AGAR|nr:hypothetical protein NP233_g9806 [Leucocoprinus birnbaumii]